MKQKYTIQKNDENNVLSIKEFAELDKEIMSMICEQKYDMGRIREAKERGAGFLMSALRTDNMYPPSMYMEKIAEAVMEILNSNTDQPFDVQIEELDFLLKDREKAPVVEEIEEESSEIDDILDDNLEDEFDDKDHINSINSPLQIADDESLDVDDDN